MGGRSWDRGKEVQIGGGAVQLASVEIGALVFVTVNSGCDLGLCLL